MIIACNECVWGKQRTSGGGLDDRVEQVLQAGRRSWTPKMRDGLTVEFLGPQVHGPGRGWRPVIAITVAVTGCVVITIVVTDTITAACLGLVGSILNFFTVNLLS